MTELLPCPFCGDTDQLPVYDDERKIWVIDCGECPASVIGSIEGTAVAAWNRRVNLPNKHSETNEQRLERELPAFKESAEKYVRECTPEKATQILDNLGITTQNPSHTPSLNCQCESCMRHLY